MAISAFLFLVSADVDIGTIRHVPHRAHGGLENPRSVLGTAVLCDAARSELMVYHGLDASFYTDVLHRLVRP